MGNLVKIREAFKIGRQWRRLLKGYTVDYVMSRQVGQDSKREVSSHATTHNGKNVTTNEVTLELSARRRAQEERIRLVFG